MMSKSVFVIAVVGAAGIVAAYAASANDVAATVPVAPATSHADATHPVVLELYQSQGCSSCPPANIVLNEVANRRDVLALNFAVTYWDRLGWKDSFARPEFTARQWDYARTGGRGNVQTPQLIVDGKVAILGSRKNEVDAAIVAHRPASGAPEIGLVGNAVSVSAGLGKAAQVWLVSYDPHVLAVPVRAGENGGRTLVHRNIVKALTSLGTWTGKAARFPLPEASAGVSRAILVQTGTGGSIIAARKI
jgi:hypothetical protein